MRALSVLVALLVQFVLASTQVMAEPGLRLFEDKQFGGKSVPIAFMTDVPTLADSKYDFNDRATSWKYEVPEGWILQLCGDKNFGPWVKSYEGKGELADADVENINDELTSIRWVKK